MQGIGCEIVKVIEMLFSTKERSTSYHRMSLIKLFP